MCILQLSIRKPSFFVPSTRLACIWLLRVSRVSKSVGADMYWKRMHLSCAERLYFLVDSTVKQGFFCVHVLHDHKSKPWFFVILDLQLTTQVIPKMDSHKEPAEGEVCFSFNCLLSKNHSWKQYMKSFNIIYGKKIWNKATKYLPIIYCIPFQSPVSQVYHWEQLYSLPQRL